MAGGRDVREILVRILVGHYDGHEVQKDMFKNEIDREKQRIKTERERVIE